MSFYTVYTPDEDAEICNIIWETRLYVDRIIRISTSKFENITYAQIKIFKKWNVEWRIFSYVWLNIFEFDTLLSKISEIKESIEQAITLKPPTSAGVDQCQCNWETPQQDVQKGNWFQDLTENKYRKLRLSVIVLDNQPNNIYIQLKLFKLKDGKMLMHKRVNLTSEEFNIVCRHSEYIRHEFDKYK